MRLWISAGALAVATAVVVSVVSSAGSHSNGGLPNTDPGPVPHGFGGGVRLVAYTGCNDMLTQLRAQTAKNVGPYGIGQPQLYAEDAAGAAPGTTTAAAAPGAAAPDHSTTNDHEVGADEPDIVKTDGNRIITVNRGVLRVIDTATRKVTGSVTIADPNQSYGPADLLLDGDRALVIMDGGATFISGGRYVGPSFPSARYVLVDLSGQPRVLGAITPNGSYVDARLIGSTVRLVVRSQPNITFPQWDGRTTQQQVVARNRQAAMNAPLRAWQPAYEIIGADGAKTSRVVPCERMVHPVDYTGTSMLTIYSIDMRAGLHDLSPLSLAADGDTVYATTTSLYVTSNPRWFFPVVGMPMRGGIAVPQVGGAPASTTPVDPRLPVIPRQPPEQTEIHRFDISAPGVPRYVASGKVSGRLLNQYSLSDYNGYLRVATTTGTAIADEPGGQSSQSSTSTSSVYVLRADSLAKVGEVDGLGKHQRIYSVRFIGPVGYVVTFKQMDPLYTLDLSDPTAPRVVGQLELTGYSAYLHPAADGRLIGIGQDATEQGRPTGLQVSLFDVSDPAHPRRVAQLVKTDAASGAEYDPHAFLYWPKTGMAVLPYNDWQGGSADGGVLVMKIADSTVQVTGTITQPTSATNDYQQGITRALVIGDSIWTLSDSGLAVNSTATLARQAWISLN